ncbi:uncharacterized protein LOC119274572 [Triticum dicoccoides]|uniref:uncharacterized protein LOC119274572 n=1 Tax=Triticum dicoccoides TaxID=85692 RepID=UPI001890210E|nr:uncharacterized protein LOC119274572 [Triticum dicoccoides]XP_044406600.1 uncharacterized protein LOC123130838 [Triticum aestivum]
MASQPPPPPPPTPKKKKKSPSPAPTTICALGDDLLREVFLCLPSLPSLVRASLTCRPFLGAVRSSPAFRRRFSDLHSPPLLGIFLSIHDPALPAFAPTRRLSDVDHAAAIRGADVFLTLLPEDDKDADREWAMEDCRDGYVVLVNWGIKQMAVYDPLTRALDLFSAPPDKICSGMHVEFHMLGSEECHGEFRVASVCHDEWGAQAAVFSSDSREWQVFPFSEDGHCNHDGTMVNGFLYWTFTSGANILVLNTATL